MIETLSLDIETYSGADLRKAGVYRYAQSPDFDILLLGYAVNGESARTIDIAGGEKVPDWLLDAIADKAVTKWAFNAMFERVCLSSWIRRNRPEKFTGYGSSDPALSGFLDPSSWRCTLVWSAYNGLPLSLEGVGKVLSLEDQKLSEGRSLLRCFCTPCAPTQANGFRNRNLPRHDPGRWSLFRKYNIRDVDAEVSIQKRLANYPVPGFVWEEYRLDQMINDRGILVDMDAVSGAIAIDRSSRQSIISRMTDLTDMDNPNSVCQMKSWLSANGLDTGTLGKKAVTGLLGQSDGVIRDVLMLRLQLARSSIRKYEAMESMACSDNRARGCFQFYGASRTGRWSGRHIQLQNLPQNHIPDLDAARSLVRSGDQQTLEILYDDVPDTLSQLIRTAFIPRPGCKFIVSDFSAIEARVLSCLAGESWRMKVFEEGGDIYCASASRMFRVPVVKHGINGHLRQKGKIAELALGYGGASGALRAMGALEMGLGEEELPGLVSAWRASNPMIVKLWHDVDDAASSAVRLKAASEAHGIRFSCRSGMLFVTLPSGRFLSYAKPRIGLNAFGSESITYEGTGASKKWERIETYGPKLVENIVQGLSRDILCHAMRNLEAAGFPIVMHIHDECVIEAPPGKSLEEACAIMGRTPAWAPGLVLRADGYECGFYMKD